MKSYTEKTGLWEGGLTPDIGEQYILLRESGGKSQQAWTIATPKPIRTITKRSFMQRFDQTERIAIRKSTDDIVIDIYEDLKMASSVDLDLQDTINAVAYLDSKSLLTVKTPAELLANGTQAESI